MRDAENFRLVEGIEFSLRCFFTPVGPNPYLRNSLASHTLDSCRGPGRVWSSSYARLVSGGGGGIDHESPSSLGID